MAKAKLDKDAVESAAHQEQNNSENTAGENLGSAPFEEDVQAPIDPNAIAVPTFEELIETQVAKYDVTEAKIGELKTQYLPLTIAGIEDSEGYEKVKAALKSMVTLRNRVEDKRKELKADSIKYQKAIDGKAKEITEKLAPIEAHLASEKEKIDAETRKIAAQKEEERQQKLKDRHIALLSAGMNLIGDTYMFMISEDDHESLHQLNLETMDDVDFNEFQNKIEALQQDALNKAEEERKRQEQERIKQQEEQELLQKQQKQMEEDRQKLLDEQKQIKDERFEMRVQKLENLGVVKSDMTGFFFYGQTSIITKPEVYEADREQFEAKLVEITARVAALKEEAEKKKKEQELEDKRKADAILRTNERIALLIEAGFTQGLGKYVFTALIGENNSQGVVIAKSTIEEYSDEDFSKLLQDSKNAIIDLKNKAAEYQKKLADDAENLRQQSLSDVQRMQEYTDSLLAINKPEMKTKKWQNALRVLVSTIEEQNNLTKNK